MLIQEKAICPPPHTHTFLICSSGCGLPDISTFIFFIMCLKKNPPRPEMRSHAAAYFTDHFPPLIAAGQGPGVVLCPFHGLAKSPVLVELVLGAKGALSTTVFMRKHRPQATNAVCKGILRKEPFLSFVKHQPVAGCHAP